MAFGKGQAQGHGNLFCVEVKFEYKGVTKLVEEGQVQGLKESV